MAPSKGGERIPCTELCNKELRRGLIKAIPTCEL